jgi:hypothetical protein
MDTSFQVPASWSEVRADVVGTTAEGEVGMEGASEHPTKRATTTPIADK